MRQIDYFLNRITMYRLVLYCLIFLLAVGFVLSIFGKVPFEFYSLIGSVSVLTISCWVTNTIFSKILKIPTNLESVYITALILSLIITPPVEMNDYSFLIWAGVFSISGKYIFNINGKHIFNPAAFGVVVTSFAINQSATWWVGTSWMTPFVFLSGILIVRKIKRFDLAISFIVVSTLMIIGSQVIRGGNPFTIAERVLLNSPILFFASIMLTEPFTTPPKKIFRVLYGTLVGIMFAPFIHIGNIYSTPELALLAGNVFSYLVSPKERLFLQLKEKIKLSPNVYEFVFGKKLKFVPGQYMEWTLSHKNTDSRGSRRYFTLASSPTEDDLRIGVKFYPDSSSWKKNLLRMNPGDRIVAGQLAGEFVMPGDKSIKLAFIAGGIGITPFRSMIKYLIDKREKRDIVLLFSAKSESDFVYKDLLRKGKIMGVETKFIEVGITGYVDDKTIAKEIPDFKERMFYVSGSRTLVDGVEKSLKKIGVAGRNIKTDFFPGYA